jgi:hypothetical protein
MKLPADDGARHSVEWYALRGDLEPTLGAGDRMLVPCEGGPSPFRRETYPPRLEIDVPGGLYLLDDVGAPEEWVYRFEG